MLRNTLAAVLLFAASWAHAGLQFSDGTTTVVLKSDACMVPIILSMAPKEMKDSLFSATVIFQGRKIKACWTDLGDQFGIIDEEGDAGVVPKSAFKEMGV